jgi:hypothetical protein
LRDGTTHAQFGPLDSLARVAALVRSPDINLTRFHRRHPFFNRTGTLRLCKLEILRICHGVLPQLWLSLGAKEEVARKLRKRFQ